MIAAIIVAVALMGLAEVKACNPMSCFDQVNQYDTLQDFILRQDEVGHASFCRNVNATLDCLSEAQQNEDCPEMRALSLTVIAMKAICHGEHPGGRSLTGMEFSPCATFVNFRERLTELNRNCETDFVRYDLDDKPCGISIRGTLCMLRELNRMCGPAFTAYVNGFMEAHGHYACDHYTQKGVGNYIKYFSKSFPDNRDQ